MYCLGAGCVWFFLTVAVLKHFGWKLKNKSDAKLRIEGGLPWEGNSFSAPESDTLRHRSVDLFFTLHTSRLEIGTNVLYHDS